MKAVVLRNIGALELAEIPEPRPNSGQTLLNVTHCGLCRTDAKMWSQGHRDLSLPRILGHEVCGVDGETGARFVVWPGEACGACSYCLGGTENLCPHISIFGFNQEGGLAEKMLVPKGSLIPIPAELPSDVACMAEPAACAFNAIQQAQVREGRDVLIFGGGIVGLLVAMAAKFVGAHPFVVETNSRKLRESLRFRTALGIDAGETPPPDRFDVAVNACPSPEVLTEVVSRLKPGGCFCFFSGFTGAAAVPAHALNEIHYRQLHVVGAYGCTRAQFTRALLAFESFGEVIRLLIQEEIPPERTSESLEKILSGEAFKIIVNFGINQAGPFPRGSGTGGGLS